VGEVSVESSDFHRPTGATANEKPENSQSNQAFMRFSFFKQSLNPELRSKEKGRFAGRVDGIEVDA
jgi:hypothetical protein